MGHRIGWICVAFALTAFFSAESQAQVLRSFAQAPFRALGHGNGPGYHTCNPGPNVSYYNPWSNTNSFLVSQSPQFLARYGHELRRSPMEILQFGNQSFGRQSYFSSPQPATMYPPTPINADFVPAKKDSADGSEGSDQSVLGSSKEDSGDEEVEDRFDAEADSLSDEQEQTDDTVGGFNSLTLPGDAADSVMLLQPTGQFSPASHRSGK